MGGLSLLQSFRSDILSRTRTVLCLATMMVIIAACTPAPRATGINDPYEAQNRKVHALNKSLDRSVLKPVAHSYGTVTRGPISTGVSNFASNLSLPRYVLNDLLQLNIKEATHNTLRLAINSTVGLGGIFDVASQGGLYEKSTDFGETLHVWGVGEGAYMELPVLGPSTTRDAIGTAVDFAIDPLNRLLTGRRKYVGTTAFILKKLGDRDKYSSTVDSVLYESEDSYAQARILYLQSRRRDLSGGLTDAELEDPYAQ